MVLMVWLVLVRHRALAARVVTELLALQVEEAEPLAHLEQEVPAVPVIFMVAVEAVEAAVSS
jgi:hypothetical protein